MADLNIVLMDLGTKILPPVTGALREFSTVLEKIRAVLPQSPKAAADKAAAWGIGTTAAEGAAIGAGVGVFASGVGALPGALLGAATGAALAAAHDALLSGGLLGTAESFMKQQEHDRKDGGGRAYERPGDQYEQRIEKLKESSAAPAKATLAPIALSLNIDGRQLAESVSTALATLNALPTQAPAADGMGQFYGGDHNYPDK
jgi:hypothetical protein